MKLTIKSFFLSSLRASAETFGKTCNGHGTWHKGFKGNEGMELKPIELFHIFHNLY